LTLRASQVQARSSACPVRAAKPVIELSAMLCSCSPHRRVFAERLANFATN
jgi:hypothetical protein